MIAAGGRIERTAWAQLTIADLRWVADLCPDGTEPRDQNRLQVRSSLPYMTGHHM